MSSLTPFSKNELSEVKEIIQPHPLMIDVVLREVFQYLDSLDSSTSKSSHITLKNARSVCHKWNEYINSYFFARSIIMKQSCSGLDYLLKVFPITEDPDLDLEPAKITALKINPEWFNEKEKFHQWMQFHGPNLTRMTLSGKIHLQRDLYPLLQEWCTNLEELTLDEVMINEDFDQEFTEDNTQILAFWDSFHPISKLKYLAVATINNDYCEYLLSAIDVSLFILLQAKNLESLTLYCSLPVSYSLPFVTELIEPEANFFVGDFSFCVTQRVKKALSTLKLREIRVFVKNNISFVSDLTLVAETLVKFHVHVENGKVLNAEVGFPQLLKMEEFIYSYSSDLGYFEQGENGSDDCFSCYYYGYREEMQILVSPKMIISSMPGLRSWIVKQCDARWMSKGYGSNCYFTNRGCASGRCSHVRELLVPMMEVTAEDQVALPRKHECLEKLEFSCCFKKSELILNLTSVYVNLKDLSIWIRSTELYAYFGNLTSLRNLERFKVQLSMCVRDFPNAINSNLPLFKNLKELSFEKCNGIRNRKAVHDIAHVDEAHTGFSECKMLEILSVKSMKIDVKELNILRNALLKSKPNLAVNAEHCCCLD